MVRNILRPDQLEDLEKALSLDGRLCLLGEVRTGKTLLALAITEALKCQRVLLIGFNSFLPAWDMALIELDFKFHEPYYLPITFLTKGTVLDRGRKLREIRRSGRPGIVAINFESWWRSDIRQAVRDWQPDMIIYDEAHRLISRSTKAARFAHQIALREPWAKHILALTATYEEGGHEDTFSLFKATRPEVFGRDFEVFRSKYLVEGTHQCKACGQIVSEVKQLDRSYAKCEHPWHRGWFIPLRGVPIIGYQNTDELFRLIQENSVRRTQAELNILPPITTTVPITLSTGSRRQYDDFMRTYVEKFTDGSKSVTVAARIALSALVKAQELTGGWVQDGSKNIIDVSSEKLDMIVDVVKEDMRHGRRPAVYGRFTHDIERLCRALNVDPKLTYSSLASDKQRKDTFKQILSGNLDIIIGISQMVAYGLNLSHFDTANFYSLGYSSIEYAQLNGRLQTQGKQPLHRYFIAEGSVDEDVFRALSTKTELRLSVFGNTALQDGGVSSDAGGSDDDSEGVEENESANSTWNW